MPFFRGSKIHALFAIALVQMPLSNKAMIDNAAPRMNQPHNSETSASVSWNNYFLLLRAASTKPIAGHLIHSPAALDGLRARMERVKKTVPRNPKPYLRLLAYDGPRAPTESPLEKKSFFTVECAQQQERVPPLPCLRLLAYDGPRPFTQSPLQAPHYNLSCALDPAIAEQCASSRPLPVPQAPQPGTWHDDLP